MPLDSSLDLVLSPLTTWDRLHGPDYASFITRSTRSLPARSLEIRLRGGDAEASFAIQGVRGSPFEQLFTVADLDENEAARVVAEFVVAILSEKLVLVMSRGAVKGGREFIRPEDLAQRAPSSIRWSASWNGTYDRGLFGA